MSYALGRMGYQVEYALTLEEGSDKLVEFKPDLVLLDINLPDGSGLDIIPQLTKLQITFLIISAYDDKEEVALEKGASGFIKKPFDLRSITRSIVDISINGNEANTDRR